MPRKPKIEATPDAPAPRTFRVCEGRQIRYPKPYKKSGKYRVLTAGDTVTSAEIPLAQCLHLVGNGNLEEVLDE